MIRLGKPFVEGAVEPSVLLRQLTDIEGKGRDFYQQVFLVEIEDEAVHVLPYRQWGELQTQEKKRTVFVPDLHLAVAAPVIVPTGGNARVPQGRYAVPVYPFYRHDQVNTVASLSSFLNGRVAKTFDGSRYSGIVAAVSEELAERIMDAPESKGLIVLVDVHSGAYSHEPPFNPRDGVRLGPGHDENQELWANLAWILDKLWWAKLEEGGQYGHDQDGVCSFCRKPGEVVSLYSKAWPWFSVTWTAPFSTEVSRSALHEAIAVCQQCYAALSYGGKLFTDLSNSISPQILQEVFKGNVNAPRLSSVPRLNGSALVLPVLDSVLENEMFQQNILQGVRKMREKAGSESGADRHLGQIVGFDARLPEELADDAFRLTLIYYTIQNADVQLWAVIEDVLPSSVARLYDDLLFDLNEYAQELEFPSYQRSIPSLLGRAYGSGYLWQSLTHVLRLEELKRERFVHRVSANLQEAGKASLHGSLWPLQTEAKFYMLFSWFLRRLHVLASPTQQEEKGGGGIMRTWQELQAMANGDPSALAFGDDVEDLGFVMGHLVRRFSAQYYRKTSKDYLTQRVMTFGTALTPDVAGFRALGKIEELSHMLNMGLDPSFRQRIAVCLAEFTRNAEAVRKVRDAFMAAFWSGYGLYDLGSPQRAVKNADAPIQETN